MKYIEIYMDSTYYKIALGKYKKAKAKLKCSRSMFPYSVPAKFYYNGDRKHGYIRHLSRETASTLRSISN